MFTFMNDAEDDPIFGPHMRHMRQMNNMMSSMMADPFGMFGGGMLPSLPSMPSSRHPMSLMPFMPPMNINRLLSGGLQEGMMQGSSYMPGSSYSSSTVVMSSGPNGRPQVISSTSSTKVGPNGVKETRKTLEDTRTGTKKMAVGHHIGERAHVIEREQNVYSGDQEEHEDFINIDEEEAEDFNREFKEKAGPYLSRARIGNGYPSVAQHSQLALPSPPSVSPAQLALPAPSTSPTAPSLSGRPSARRPIRQQTSPLAAPAIPHRSSGSVRDTYSGAQPRQRPRHGKPRAVSPRRSPHH